DIPTAPGKQKTAGKKDKERTRRAKFEVMARFLLDGLIHAEVTGIELNASGLAVTIQTVFVLVHIAGSLKAPPLNDLALVAACIVNMTVTKVAEVNVNQLRVLRDAVQLMP